MILFQLRRATRKIDLFERTPFYDGMIMQSADVSLTDGDLVCALQRKGRTDEHNADDWFEIFCSRGIFWVRSYTLCWDTLEV